MLMIEGKLTEDGQEPQIVQVGIVTHKGMPDKLDMELIGKDEPFLSIQLQRAAMTDALVGTLESDPGDSEEEESQKDDSPSTELQQV